MVGFWGNDGKYLAKIVPLTSLQEKCSRLKWPKVKTLLLFIFILASLSLLSLDLINNYKEIKMVSILINLLLKQFFKLFLFKVYNKCRQSWLYKFYLRHCDQPKLLEVKLIFFNLFFSLN
jgi:hypothetical protein